MFLFSRDSISHLEVPLQLFNQNCVQILCSTEGSHIKNVHPHVTVKGVEIIFVPLNRSNLLPHFLTDGFASNFAQILLTSSTIIKKLKSTLGLFQLPTIFFIVIGYSLKR